MRVLPAGGARGAVGVYLVPLGADVAPADLADAEAVLDPREVARSRRGTPEVRRRRVLRRAALRRALAAELGVEPRAVPLTEGPTGRPGLPEGTGLDASASSSGDLGLVAVARGSRVGVDLEQVRPWSDETLDEGWLAPVERAALLALPEPARAVAAARAWTQKEAVLKGRGTGLGEDPAAVVTAIGHADGVLSGWRLGDVPVPGGWVASLAVAPVADGPLSEERA